MFAVEWHKYLNTLYRYILKSFYLMIFFEIICFEFPSIDRAQIPNPKPHLKRNLSLQKFSFNTYFVNFVLRWFLPFDVWFQLKPRIAGFVFSTVDLCRYLLLRRCGCDFCKVCFSCASLVHLVVHYFCWLSFQYFGVRFPNSRHVSNFDFEISFRDWRSFF